MSHNDALFHSYECFMNAFLRDALEFAPNYDLLVGQLQQSLGIDLAIQKLSLTSRHHYKKSALIDAKKVQEIFSQCIQWYQERCLDQMSVEKKQLLNRFVSSLEVIEQTLEMRRDELETLADRSHFLQTEQGLFYGHNFHPHPKSREQWNQKQMSLYCPEFAASLQLLYLKVDPQFLTQKNFCEDEQEKFYRLLELEGFEKEENLLPIHPYQFEWLNAHHLGFARLLKEKKIVSVGLGKLQWSPTSSVRSLYNSQSDLMIKTSLSVKLTNSVRDLTLKESQRGGMVVQALKTTQALAHLQKYPNFHPLFEPALRYLQIDGQPIEQSIVVTRENPFVKNHDQDCWCLATLLQKRPSAHTTYLEEKLKDKRSAHEWWRGFLETVMTPLLTIHSELGIWLGAHQQNIIVKLSTDGLIQDVYFRDCQGTGYTFWAAEQLKESGVIIDQANGNILPAEVGNALFSYYLFINTLLNTISALSWNNLLSEKDLLKDFKTYLLDLKKSGLKDESCVNYLLDSKLLWQKGNFKCSAFSLNENTQKNPFSLYTKIENPLWKI